MNEEIERLTTGVDMLQAEIAGYEEHQQELITEIERLTARNAQLEAVYEAARNSIDLWAMENTDHPLHKAIAAVQTTAQGDN